MSIPAYKINSGSIDAPQAKPYPTNRAVIESSQGRSEADEAAQGNQTGEDESGDADGPAGYTVPVR